MNAIKAFRTVPVDVVVQLLSRVLLFATPWMAAHQTVVRTVLGAVRTLPGTWQPLYKCLQSLPSSPCHYQPQHQHHVIILTCHHHLIITTIVITSSTSSPYCHHHHHHLINTITAIIINITIFTTVIIIVKYLLRPNDKLDSILGSENSRD